MSHPSNFDLWFIEFKETPPVGFKKDNETSNFGYHWRQCDSEPEGWSRWWPSQWQMEQAIETAGGPVPWLLENAGDLVSAMLDQFEVGESQVLHLNVNGSFAGNFVRDEEAACGISRTEESEA